MESFKQERRNFLKLLGISGGAALLGGIQLPISYAKEIYPSGRITWINPVSAAGGSDLIARSIAQYLGKYLKEGVKDGKGGDVMVKNVTGAGGRKAYNMIFNAKPDGYTIGDFNNSFVTENISSKVEFDYNKYTYIARTGVSLHLVVTSKNGFKTWDEMIQAGKNKELKWGVTNFGRTGHVTSILLKEATNIPARFINFPGGPECLGALLRGDVQVATGSESAAKALLEAGELRVLTVLTEKSHYAGVPSIAELGYPEMTGPLGQHRLLVGPPNVPTDIVNTLVTCLKKVFSDKDFLAVADKLEFDPDPLYGVDAERKAHELFKFYDEKIPILKKYLT